MKNLLLLIFILLSTLIRAQQTNVGPLLDYYKEQCDLYKDVNADSLGKYAHEGIALAEKENSETILTTFYRYAGISRFQKQEFEIASSYLDKALKLAVKLNDKSEEAAAYLAMGYMYGLQSDAKLRIEYMLKALPMFETLGDNDKAMEILVGIGSSYRRAGNQELAVEYLDKAKGITEKANNDFLKALLYFELGAITPDVNSVIEYELKAIEYARSANNKSLENLANQALAITYTDELEDYNKALIYANECYRIAKEQGSSYYIFSALTMLSNIYNKQKNYKASEAVSLEAWAIDSTNLAEGKNLARNIAIANIYSGDKEKAVVFLQKYVEAMNKYTEESYHKELVELTTQYETEKKETRIAVLEGERKLYIGMGIAIVAALLLGIGFLFYRHRSIRQKQKIAVQQIKQLEQEKELIAVRSALDAEKAEREIIARDLHDGIGAMLSVVKNNMNIIKPHSIIGNAEADHFNKALDVLDKSIIELRRVAHHIMPATLIDKGLVAALDDFCRSIPEVEFHISEPNYRIDAEVELVLYRCAYELVSNALRHSGASHIDVHLNMDEDTVYLSVVDNGCGFDPQTTSTGMGINNLRTRLSAFNGRIDIFSTPEKGTEVNVELDIRPGV